MQKFIQYYITTQKRITDVDSPAGKREYATIFLGNLILLFVYSVFMHLMVRVVPFISYNSWLIAGGILVFFLYVSLAVVSVRRLRDAGLSPLWILLYLFPGLNILLAVSLLVVPLD